MPSLTEFRNPTPGNDGSTWDGGHFYSGRDPSSPKFDPELNGRAHAGFDQGAPEGSDIVAPAEGVVARIDFNEGAGHWIAVAHQVAGHTLYSRHLHCQDVFPVAVGDPVVAGQSIARVGSTGAAEGPHNHTELVWGKPQADWTEGLHIDPEYAYFGHTPANQHGGPAMIQGLQQALADAGYNPGAIDGQFGPETRPGNRRWWPECPSTVTSTGSAGPPAASPRSGPQPEGASSRPHPGRGVVGGPRPQNMAVEQTDQPALTKTVTPHRIFETTLTGIGAAAAGFGVGFVVGEYVFGGIALAAVAGASAGVNGLFCGARRVYAWRTWSGWYAWLADSSWALTTTTLGNLLNMVNLTRRGSGYRPDFSFRQNRQVYELGFALKRRFANTQGCVISNAGTGRKGSIERRRRFVDRHETLHIWQQRWFGPLFPALYLLWGIGGTMVALVYWLATLRRSKLPLGRLIETAAYYDNPFEYWAYRNDDHWADNRALSALKW